MKQIKFESLVEALAFVEQHGGPVRETTWQDYPKGYNIPFGAFAGAGSGVVLKDGSLFIVEAFTIGPLSEVTPDEDFGVNLLGFE